MVDINGDGKDDIFFGASKLKAPSLFFQDDSTFVETPFLNSNDFIKTENIVASIKDFNNDGLKDIILGNGGSDYYGKMNPLTNSYFIQKNETFIEQKIPESYENTSVIIPYDYDKDGDLDIFVGNHSITGDYGKAPDSYLMNNDKGIFSNLELDVFKSLGMINDAIWTDFNNDGEIDLIMVGEWLKPIFVKGSNKNFKLWDSGINEVGLWQTIYPFDLDKDGDIDYMLGNWGNNSKFKASDKYPLRMYYGDLDKNGSSETIVAINKNGKYYPIESFNQLANQMNFLRKKYPSYKDFAGKDITQIFGEKLIDSKLFEANQLSSGYLQNNDGSYKFVEFDEIFQVAPITAFIDLNIDGKNGNELIVAGNYFGLKPFMGRLGSFPGAIYWDAENYELSSNYGMNLLNKAVRKLSLLNFQSRDHLMVTINNAKVEIYQIIK